MFMPETEDMLPRSAPRPSAPVPLGHTDEIVKPTVPEVSILFGQQPPQQQQQQHQHQQQQKQSTAPAARPVGSFASWKKQILPRVNFSPVLTTELGPTTSPTPSSAAISTPPTSNEYNYLPRSRSYDAERPMPVQPQAINSNMGYATSPPTHYVRETYHNNVSVPPSRSSTTNANPLPIVSDVLTICAGTQTDSEPILRRDLSPELSNLVNKQDMREVLDLLQIMRQEQHQLRRLCESLTQQQQQQQQATSGKTFKETASQCELVAPNKNAAMVKRITPIVQDYIVEEDELPAPFEKPARALPQFQSPRAASPMAQSTGYRTNTPQGKQPSVPASKPSTEKSMVMSELALKYLPQKQINELMDELRLSPKTTANDVAPNAGGNTTPLRQIDNFTQSPSNMSNASYKYLKKYRLLPEEQMTYDHHLQRTGSPGGASPQRQSPAMLDLDNIRNQPKLI